MAKLEAWILAFFKANGRRPTQKDEGVAAWDNWALRQGTSISKVCDRLGMPKLRYDDRDMAGMESYVRECFKANGRRPTQKDEGGAAWDNWARTQGTSLREVCDRLGMPKLRYDDRDMAGMESYVRDFFKVHGRRPTVNDEGGTAWNHWARAKGTSLREVCDRLGLPKFLDIDRCMASLEAYVRSFFKSHGRRPAWRDKGCSAWSQWALRQGTSISKVCDRLGMPKLRYDAMDMAGCEAYAHEFFNSNGRRPTKKDNGAGVWHSWARTQGTSLPQVCDRLGIPRLSGDNRKPSQPPPPPKSGTNLRKGVKKKKVEE